MTPSSRLQHLYEVSKVLARFESVEQTVPEVLALVSEVVPLRIAVLMLEDRTAQRPRIRAIAWHAEGASASRLRAAKAHAKTAYAYLTRTVPNVEEEAGAAPLPASIPPPPESGKEGFVLLPLVIDQHRIFGALEMEGATRLDETDLTFVNAIVNQLAIALDRIAQVKQAIQARQDLLAFVSHDLKNPLGSILMISELLLRAPPTEDPGELKKRVEVIQRSAYRMNRLLGALLDAASIEAGHLSVEKKRHPGGHIVREAIELYAAVAAQKTLRLEGALPGGEFEVDCDRDRILQVLGNLIGNAIKFTPEGGTIRVMAEQRGEEALFSVADTGQGIGSDELAHVFERYWQAKKRTGLGTGLGLCISKGIVESHEGRIWAESTPGHGATFFFTLPVVSVS
jgi:signal transduction histidine kinase